jgi:imidazolonepropionase-like amidohydrolase
MTVAITGDRITAIEKTSRSRLPKGAPVVNAQGKFLIPGLWDMHVHLDALEPIEEAPEILVSYGITSVRDMGGHWKRLQDLRSSINQGLRIGPSIYMAGYTLNGDQAADFHLVLKTPRDAQEAVQKFKNGGVDFIKVHNQLSREVFYAVAAESKKQGLDFVGHVPHGISLLEAAEAGMKTVEHIEVLMETELYQKEDPAPGLKEALDRLRGEHGERVFSTFVRNGTAYTPTLSAYWDFVSSAEKAEAKAQGEALFRRFIELTGQMDKAGVMLLAGTDYRADPGKRLHEELAFLVQAGLAPMEALQAATLRPAQVLGVTAKVGTIEVGKQADLVLLEGDPLEDVLNTRRIAGVVLRGHFLDNDILMMRLKRNQDSSPHGH